MGVLVSLDEERSYGQSAIIQLQNLVTKDMNDVNRLIFKQIDSDVPIVMDLASHLISSGGKRLRPMLTIASSHICGYQGREHIKLAASIEFLHTATLLHDDVVDESNLRRGQKTARMFWGNQASVLVGDFLLGRAFRLMVETKSIRVLEIIANAASSIAEGEVMQFTASKDTSTTEDIYMRIIQAKTAALFAASTEVSAVIAECDTHETAALASYGHNVGIVFQLVDDALDYCGRIIALGKSIGNDFHECKVTLPVILAFQRGSIKERAFWRRTLQQGKQKNGDLEHAKALMTRYNAIEDTIFRAKSYGAIAKDALKIFPESHYRQVLIDIVDFCINRTY